MDGGGYVEVEVQVQRRESRRCGGGRGGDYIDGLDGKCCNNVSNGLDLSVIRIFFMQREKEARVSGRYVMNVSWLADFDMYSAAQLLLAHALFACRAECYVGSMPFHASSYVSLSNPDL